MYWLIVQPPVGAPLELAIAVEAGATIADLLDALVRYLALPNIADGESGVSPDFRIFHDRAARWLPFDESVEGIGLALGDRLTIGRPFDGPGGVPRQLPRTATGGDARIELAVTAGPLLGHRVELADGSHVVGRDPAASVIVADDVVSRRHLRIDVSGDRVTIDDTNSANGTTVDRRRLTDPYVLDVADSDRGTPDPIFEIGSTAFVIRRREPTGHEAIPDVRGRIPFNRPPRIRVGLAPYRAELAAPPPSPRRTAFSMATSIAPLVFGVVIWLITSNPLMLLFCLLSPVIAVASRVEERRRGHRGFHRDRRAFAAQLEAELDRLGHAVRTEAAHRRHAAPDLADLAARAVERRADVWERRPSDDDFLVVRVGGGTLPALAQVEIASGGDDDMRQHAEAELARYRYVEDVPITVDLHGITGICSTRSELAHQLARSMVAQAAVLHSPRDLAIVVAVSRQNVAPWNIAKWLPQTNADTSPVDGRSLVVGVDTATDLIAQLLELVERRRAAASRRPAHSVNGPNDESHVVVIVDEATAPDRALINRLMQLGPAVGVSLVWVGGVRRDLPGECTTVIELHADRSPALAAVSHAPFDHVVEARADLADDEVLAEVALALCPLRDVTARAATGLIPSRVSLTSVLDLGSTTHDRPDRDRPDQGADIVDAVLERWARPRRDLDAVVGLASDGPFTIAMRRDGPHALIAGMTGSGKSELLQTLVTSLAVSHPPERITFLLIDYKGGAAFRESTRLPHCVGYVTDLDGRLADRALVSLRAEVRRREGILDTHRAKDLADLEARRPDDAPPSLLIVIDELAALVREVPDFVDGLVDVAQRGRSLGIHLVLATQRPSGVLSDAIRANTNLRIALRVSDSADSADVIHSDAAARLPRSAKGRAFVRTGPAELTEVQCAYAGNPATSNTARTAAVSGQLVDIAPLGFDGVIEPAREMIRVDRPTELSSLVDACVRAAARRAMAAPIPPWLPPLPDRIGLDTLLPLVPHELDLGADPGRHVVVGLVDDPATQSQRVQLIDLEQDGGLLALGTGGSGKTTLLRSVAASLAPFATNDTVHLYAMDFAGRGLDALAALPFVGSVIDGHDGERIVRLLTLLRDEVATRRAVLAELGAATLSEVRRRSDVDHTLPRVVVLIDGFHTFTSTYDRIEFGEWSEVLQRIIVDGRAVGIHVLATAPRRASIPGAVASAISGRVLLRMADDDELVAAGIPVRVARSTVMPPGRGFVGDALELQVAIVGDEPSGAGQTSALTRLGAMRAGGPSDRRAPPIRPFPTVLSTAELPPPDDGWHPIIGVADPRVDPIAIDLTRGTFIVAGAPRAGRSTTLAAMAASIVQASSGPPRHLWSTRPNPMLTSIEGWSSIAVGRDSIMQCLMERRAESPASGSVVFIDGAEDLLDSMSASALEPFVRDAARLGCHLVISADTAAIARSYGNWLAEARLGASALILQPHHENDGEPFGVRLRWRTTERLPLGRGFLCIDRHARQIHVARP